MDLKSLEALGITAESLVDRIVDKAVEDLMSSVQEDEDGGEWRGRSTIARRLDERIKALIDSKVADLADKHVLPHIAQYVENLTLQETNKWGEKNGIKKLTFIEYLIHRTEAYMVEEVNYNGKTKDQDSYSWSKHSTRITHAVNSHLQYSIDTAMKQALANANSAIAAGLEGAVKIALQEATAKLKVAVTTR